ncbi:RNA-binding protein 48 [Marchantia polymorpha subsp. ruderalis]|uniref:RNA-binding protein 48 n=2 Tax=Marchantia polymorpha TaxID=3197 RepID=A0A176WA25_MARPO|nr:hypothetical protein AXG93_2960s1350 [Marchantia polymorpha subsp. ruderalis]PTQ42567.1 hypothetical protein MARPO_0029s0094 [Marchantia polymorpha]BBM96916.1 hypothetical protein Mp_1g01530 [Marchantia polymorpha subsp. ruderalis]|eukprot:PTQ42567.1 hypothetical protein MARPO_0029s0094 [Marchantia polymorpha]
MQRPDYRSSRRERAVRVYTICDESRYLIVKNVPALGCVDELVKLFGLYGPIEEYRTLDEEDCEPFTDVYWIKYSKLGNATFAKRKLDDYKFLGNLLEVSYAPQYETLSDTRDKLEERRRTVLNRIRVNAGGQHQAHRPFPTKRSLAEPHDPLLIHSGDQAEGSGRYAPLLLEPSSRSRTEDTGYNLEGRELVCRPEVEDVANVEYFSSPSMTATVRKVRETLAKIEATSLPQIRTGTSEDDSSVPTQRIEAERSVPDESSSLLKKRRQDSRRRI